MILGRLEEEGKRTVREVESQGDKVAMKVEATDATGEK